MTISIQEISPIIKAEAPKILAEVKKAKSVLLHCHPSPDPDSVGSALAMKFALEGMGKNVTVIRGDNEIPEAFAHFPGAGDIVAKNFFEVNLADFDLFIIQDSGSTNQISKLQPITFPLPIRTVVIDHHASNTGFADINLIDPSIPATAQVLYELFSFWDVKITPEIASNIFIGMYTDTGGFKYTGTTYRTYDIVSKLVRIVPDFPQLISKMENSTTLAEIKFQAIALGSIETFLDDKLGLAVVSYEMLKKNSLSPDDVNAGLISSILRSVVGLNISGVLIETEPGLVKSSFRSKDGNTYDVSKLTVSLGGGGHKAAAGATMNMTIDVAKKLVVEKVKEIYNL